MNPYNFIFFQFHHKNNLLDTLIREFQKRNYNINKTASQLFHEFEWPDIVLSGKNRVIFDPITHKKIDKDQYYGCIELFGEYEINYSNEEEGRVVLYYHTIENIANRYLLANPAQIISIEEIIELISIIVLIHEFTHWIMHWIRSGKILTHSNKRFCPFKYHTEDQVNFHEGFAQLFTFLICKENPYLMKIFLWLEIGQPNQYKKYKELLHIGIDNFSSAIDCLRYFSYSNIQSFELIKKNHEEASKNNVRKYDSANDLDDNNEFDYINREEFANFLFELQIDESISDSLLKEIQVSIKNTYFQFPDLLEKYETEIVNRKI